MTLTCDRPYGSNSYGKGIFINLVKIVEVEDVSGTTLPFLQDPVDIGIKLKLDIGRDFQPDLYIAGSFERAQGTDEVIGWKSGFVVQDALFRLGYTGTLSPNNSIPQHVLPTLVGKQFYRLSYVSRVKNGGKPGYSDWNMIASVDEGPQSLAARFQKSLQKGYPKNYHPELLDRDTVSSEPAAVQEDEVF